MQGKALAALTTALLGAMTFISTSSVVPTTALAAGPLFCTDLDTNPAAGLAGNPLIKSHTSQIILAWAKPYSVEPADIRMNRIQRRFRG
jgi:hypothetical protein